MLGEIPISGMKKGDKVDIKMRIDENNILVVTAIQAKKGTLKQVTIENK